MLKVRRSVWAVELMARYTVPLISLPSRKLLSRRYPSTMKSKSRRYPSTINSKSIMLKQQTLHFKCRIFEQHINTLNSKECSSKALSFLLNPIFIKSDFYQYNLFRGNYVRCFMSGASCQVLHLEPMQANVLTSFLNEL